MDKIYGVEISFLELPGYDLYEHWGYYDTIDEAIAALIDIKQNMEKENQA